MIYFQSAVIFVHILSLVQSQPNHGHHHHNNYLQNAMDHWIKFKRDHMKQFNPQEDLLRFNIFKENLKRIEEFQNKFETGLIDFRVGITEFSDLTREEFINNHLKLKMPQGRIRRDLPRSNRTTRHVPEFMDWRMHGAVTQVKHQGGCASCWAFSAIASLEGQYFLKRGQLVTFSEQNLIDCSIDVINNGCGGGWMANAFQYLMGHPIMTMSDYPYVGVQQTCHVETSRSIQISMSGFQAVQADEMSLLHAVATIGPISVAMDATNLQFYAGGVFRDDEFVVGRVNHGVVVVGYGIESGREYWLIKNSWGASWGESGYFKLARNRGNQCNIASYGMYPIL